MHNCSLCAAWHRCCCSRCWGLGLYASAYGFGAGTSAQTQPPFKYIVLPPTGPRRAGGYSHCKQGIHQRQSIRVQKLVVCKASQSVQTTPRHQRHRLPEHLGVCSKAPSRRGAGPAGNAVPAWPRKMVLVYRGIAPKSNPNRRVQMTARRGDGSQPHSAAAPSRAVPDRQHKRPNNLSMVLPFRSGCWEVADARSQCMTSLGSLSSHPSFACSTARALAAWQPMQPRDHRLSSRPSSNKRL